MPYPIIKKGVAGTFYVQLEARGAADVTLLNPTLAAGDATLSKDDGAVTNLATLPVVTPAASGWVKVVYSAAEATCDLFKFALKDVTGIEWKDLVFSINTSAVDLGDLATAAGLNTASAAELAAIAAVNAQNVVTQAAIAVVDSQADAYAVSDAAAAAAVDAKVANVQTRLPAALTAGANMKIDAVTATVTDKTGFALTSADHILIADAVFKRDLAVVAGAAARSLLNVTRRFGNRVEIVGGVMNVYAEDDTTIAATFAVTTTAGALNITGVDRVT